MVEGNRLRYFRRRFGRFEGGILEIGEGYLEMSVLRKLPGFDRLVECYLSALKETSTGKSEKVVWPAICEKVFQTRARASKR